MKQLKRLSLAVLCLTALLGLMALLMRPRSSASNTAREAAVIQTLADRFHEYQNLHPGLQATNWQQLGEVAHLEYHNNQYLGGRDPAPLQTNYVFVTSPVALLPPNYRRGEVVLIRASPKKRTGPSELGRFLISRDGTNYHWGWLPEAQVQTMFKAAKVDVPNLPASSQIEK